MKLHRSPQPQRENAIQLDRLTFFHAARQQANPSFAVAFSVHHQEIAARRSATDPQTLAAPRQPVSHRAARHR